MLTKDQAEEIKKEIWQAYNESELDTDRADAIKLACSVVDGFIDGFNR